MENEKNLQFGYAECPLPRPFSIRSLYTFSRQKLHEDYVFKGEAHDFTEVVCITNGKVGITADKNVYVLSSGQMIVHPAQEFHAIWSTEGTSPEAIIFSFKADHFPILARRIFSLKSEEIAKIRSIQLEAESAFHIGAHSIQLKHGQQARAAIVAKKLELFLMRAFLSETNDQPEYTGKSAENYVKILSVMEENIGENLTTKELASLCNMSVPTIEKAVFRYLGCGIISHFNTMKIQKAKELLLSGISVKETAFSLGFSNQNYFSSRFKSVVGVPPSSFRKE
jgi:AraC-like DNA-binding protein